jgi:hypothetical protein
MSLMMVMFQLQEEELGKQYGSEPEKNKNVEDLLSLMNNQFKHTA